MNGKKHRRKAALIDNATENAQTVKRLTPLVENMRWTIQRQQQEIIEKDRQIYDLVLQIDQLTIQVQRFTVAQCLQNVFPQCITEFVIQYSGFN